jgi:hypothetical protein
MTEHRTFAVSSPTVEVAADESSITHPFAPGTHVRAAHIEIVRRPLFYRAVILAPIPSVADLYAGTIEGRRTTFFAHPELQSFGAEAALLLQFRATVKSERLFRLPGEHLRKVPK